MKILVLGGSPNKNGSTQILIENFARGAKEAGHTVTVLNVAHMDVRPCTGCIACGYDGPCVQRDDMSRSGRRCWNRICWSLPRRSTSSVFPHSLRR